MNLEQLHDFCLSLNSTSVDSPFGPDVLAFRVCKKIFALVSLSNQPYRINLKCDPNDAIALREEYPAVTPGYHMNKQHWNTVLLDGSINQTDLKKWITDSYNLVKPKNKKQQ